MTATAEARASLANAMRLLERVVGCRHQIVNVVEGRLQLVPTYEPGTLTPASIPDGLRLKVFEHQQDLLRLRRVGWWAHVVTSHCAGCAALTRWTGPDREAWHPRCWRRAQAAAWGQERAGEPSAAGGVERRTRAAASHTAAASDAHADGVSRLPARKPRSKKRGSFPGDPRG